ncbi:LytTR family transcriptional regulator [Sphingomonas piscis]|uniref:LytTR family transcriptional regulator n=1 Tax=Sphingomonas piscis TaxID=2714943 RepID=A0A6G7YPF4_9SPHN|nr:LytTR family DNA-binding domain-containing protein [Sphingomonas piscis]QIK78628.1 LytTR family transcriptional regulator [Sphingomonas piscis]
MKKVHVSMATKRGAAGLSVTLLAKLKSSGIQRLTPLLLIPAGAIYCLAYELLFEPHAIDVLGSMIWAIATLSPWVAGVFLFQHRAATLPSRRSLIGLALLLGSVAYIASAGAALLLGSGAERAFFTRVPLLGVALLGAALYPLRRSDGEHADVVPSSSFPPVPPAEILFACAAGNYVELHTESRTVIWRQTMRNAERVLGRSGFVRVHRSYLVPWRKIDVLVRDRKGVVEVALQNGRRLPVSSRYAPVLSEHTIQ